MGNILTFRDTTNDLARERFQGENVDGKREDGHGTSTNFVRVSYTSTDARSLSLSINSMKGIHSTWRSNSVAKFFVINPTFLEFQNKILETMFFFFSDGIFKKEPSNFTPLTWTPHVHSLEFTKHSNLSSFKNVAGNLEEISRFPPNSTRGESGLGKHH